MRAGGESIEIVASHDYEPERRATELPAVERGEVRKGTGCYPGVVRGPVRVDSARTAPVDPPGGRLTTGMPSCRSVRVDAEH